MRTIYLNGRWLYHQQALIHVEDRGFQFADGVYEALAVRRSKIIDVEAHLNRLKHSLSALRIKTPVAFEVFPHLMAETARRNYVKEGLIYLQITRGIAKRDHAFPKGARASLLIIARHISAEAMAQRRAGIHVIACPDQRWQRCDIKSLNLLPNVLARQQASEQGASEAWFMDASGKITEGTASNAWIYKDHVLRTHQSDHRILNGITRAHIVKIAEEKNIQIDETGFTWQEAQTADEAFVSSSIGGIIPVLSLEGKAMLKGELTRLLQESLEQLVLE